MNSAKSSSDVGAAHRSSEEPSGLKPRFPVEASDSDTCDRHQTPVLLCCGLHRPKPSHNILDKHSGAFGAERLSTRREERSATAWGAGTESLRLRPHRDVEAVPDGTDPDRRRGECRAALEHRLLRTWTMRPWSSPFGLIRQRMRNEPSLAASCASGQVIPFQSKTKTLLNTILPIPKCRRATIL